jgi:dihydrofolate synthase / folylpolyglutamate synthase
MEPSAIPTSPPSTLDGWLAHAERLHPVAIDMGLDRVREVAQRMGLDLGCPVITVAGTNGKGSTCAMLEAILLQAGYRTGVYTSPHLVHFVERCRIHGEAMDATNFVAACDLVERARCQKGQNNSEISLTYFEFTTLAILWVMQQAGLDVAILEVGLGGRLDAVNIIDADCAIITSIDLDHMALLGPDRESIGREKAGIMRAGRPVVVSDPVPPQSVVDHAATLGADLWRFGRDFNFNGDKLQWAWAGRGRRWAGMAYPALRGANQLVNASGVLAALEALRAQLPVTAQAVRNGLAMVELPGRFQIIPGQPTVVLDVAHNPHAVAALAQNLDAMGFYTQTHAVLGAMADKDIAPMLAKIAPLVDRWYLCDLPTPRAATAQALAQQVQAAAPGKKSLVSTHASPSLALDAALAAAQGADRIVVFGSFYTVGGVLQGGVSAISRRLTAVHVASNPAATGIQGAP